MAKTATDLVIDSITESANVWIKTHDSEFTKGQNYSKIGTEFQTWIYNGLFPKLLETFNATDTKLGNRFDPAAREVEAIGQLNEEYVITDMIPVNMDLSQPATLTLERHYPAMLTKLYRQGQLKKLKFTLNNNDVRLNWRKIEDAIGYVATVFDKQFANININEERLIKAMLVDYANNNLDNEQQIRTVSAGDFDGTANAIGQAILDMNDNSDKFNETVTATGGKSAPYTTNTKLDSVLILTSTKMKNYLLNTKYAQTFQMSGIDLTDHIIAFSDLGGAYSLTDDVTITEQDTLEQFYIRGDYVTKLGDIIEKGTVLTWDVTKLEEFDGKVEEIKPKGEEPDQFAFVFDKRALGYLRYTQGMVKPPFYTGEFDESNVWLHYYTQKFVRPFYNKILIQSA